MKMSGAEAEQLVVPRRFTRDMRAIGAPLLLQRRTCHCTVLTGMEAL